MISRLLDFLFRYNEPEPHSVGGALSESGYTPDPRYPRGLEREARSRPKPGFSRYADRETVVQMRRRKGA